MSFVVLNKDNGVENYGIRPDYECNTELVTMDAESGATYWNASRIESSRHYQFPVYELVSRIVEDKGARTLVDVGCGVGTKLENLHRAHPELEIHGIDQPAAIDWCRAHWEFGTWYADDFENPGDATRDLAADVVVCADVIEHVLDPDMVLRYLRRLSHAETWFVLSTPDREQLRGTENRRPPNPHHVREWSAPEFAAYLDSQGFTIEQQVHQLPVRATFGRYFLEEVVLRAVKLKPLRYNQVVVVRQRG